VRDSSIPSARRLSAPQNDFLVPSLCVVGQPFQYFLGRLSLLKITEMVDALFGAKSSRDDLPGWETPGSGSPLEDAVGGHDHRRWRRPRKMRSTTC